MGKQDKTVLSLDSLCNGLDKLVRERRELKPLLREAEELVAKLTRERDTVQKKLEAAQRRNALLDKNLKDVGSHVTLQEEIWLTQRNASVTFTQRVQGGRQIEVRSKGKLLARLSGPEAFDEGKSLLRDAVNAAREKFSR